MRRLLVLVVAVLPAASAVAKEVFDIARFGTPPRWQRSTSPGLLTLQAPPARGSSAQIFLFASEPTRGSPQENFRLAWQKLIAAPLGGLAPASTSAETTPDGWTAVSGASPYVRQGATWRALLITATGHGRVMSMVAQVLGTGHDREIETFFKELDLVAGPESPAAASAAPPAGGAVAPPAPGPGESGVELTPPRGWSRSPRAEALTYVSPPYPNTGEVCQLVVLPMRRGGGDLLREAVGTFQGLFRTDPMRGYPEIEPLLVRGTSPLGWPYVTVHKTLGRGGEETGGVILLVAGVGDQVATVFTVSKPPLVSQCFGEAFPSEWPAIFHSLRLKGSAPRTGEAELKKKLAGSWTTFSSHAVDTIVLATNGRYQNGAALGNATRISSTTVLWTMNTFRGDGAWTAKGASLTLTPDRGTPEGGSFRLEEESKDGRTWTERLCILGKTGDICYRRDAL